MESIRSVQSKEIMLINDAVCPYSSFAFFRSGFTTSTHFILVTASSVRHMDWWDSGDLFGSLVHCAIVYIAHRFGICFRKLPFADLTEPFL